MLKKSFISLFIIITFLFGAIIGGANNWFSGILTLNFINQTDLQIKSLQINCKSNGLNMLIETPGIKPKDAIQFKIIVPGGGIGCSIEANKLNDKKVLITTDYFISGSYNISIKAL